MDAELRQAIRGDREAMAKLADAHYDAIFRFCARRVGPDRAADLAQETFLTAQRQMRKFRGESSLKTWLFGIALNHCRNASRQRTFEPVDWTMHEPSDNPESGILDRELLRKALSALSEEHRDVVLLHEVDGLTYEEAGAVLGIPAGTVKSRLHHAFLNLRKAMGLMPEVTA